MLFRYVDKNDRCLGRQVGVGKALDSQIHVAHRGQNGSFVIRQSVRGACL